MAFTHKNSKGDTYYLHGKDVTLRNGRKQRIVKFNLACQSARASLWRYLLTAANSHFHRLPPRWIRVSKLIFVIEPFM